MKPWLYLMLAAAAVSGLNGCSTYELQGVVVEGPTPGVFVVSDDSPQLKQLGLVNASVDVTVDPNSLGGHRTGAVRTDERGWFRVPIGDMGAGFLEYDVAVLGRLPGYAPAYETLPLPGYGKRLVVVLAPGEDHDPRPENVQDEARRMEDIMKRQ